MNSLRAIWQRTRQIQIALLFAAIFVTGFALGHQNTATQAQQPSFTAPPEAETAFEPFWQVYNMIQSSYIDKVDVETLVNGAITGMVDSLGDQYSGYMTPDLYKVLNDDMDGTVEGIGAVVHTIEDTGEIEIVNVMENSPAMKAGIMAGDIFVEVNGESVEGMSQLDLVSKVRGPAGTTVELTMKRGNEQVQFSIVRARLDVPNIEHKVLDGNIGYVKLYEFNAEARKQIDDALTALDVNHLNGLILDLRGNPGGLLSSVVDVASGFIKDGVILTEEFGDGSKQVYKTNGSYIGVEVPIVVLINNTSASASELLAGALQDDGIATIIGETSFGKGTVQTWSALVNGGGVRLTIARWLTPNGNWINGKGITPDIVVEWTPKSYDDPNDPQLDTAVGYLESLATAPQPQS